MVMGYGDSRYILTYGLKNIPLLSNKQKDIKTTKIASIILIEAGKLIRVKSPSFIGDINNSCDPIVKLTKSDVTPAVPVLLP